MRSFLQSRRWLLGGALCLTLACQASSGAPGAVSRPPMAGVGPIVAHVLLVNVQAQVVAVNGFRFQAVPGLPLLRSDTLQVIAPGSFLVVELRNGYLVRLEEDTLLPVAEIVLLDAPPAREDLAVQLSRVLTPEERARSERIAGWHARMAAADSVAPQPAAPATEGQVVASQLEQRKVERKEREKRDEDQTESLPRKSVSAKGGTEARVAAKGGGEPRVAAKVDLSVRTGAIDDKTKEKSAADVLAGPRWEAPAGVILPEALAKLLQDANWVQCVREALAALPVEVRPGKLAVRVEVRAGKLARLRLGGGLPTPACLGASGVSGQPAPQGAPDGWLRLTLHVP